MKPALFIPFGWTPPEDFTLESDFSPNPTGRPIHTLTRNRDRARILVDYAEDAPPPESLHDCFPKPQDQNQATDPIGN